MKTLRYMKLRTLAPSAESLARGLVTHPLKRALVPNATHEWTDEYLNAFRRPLDWNEASIRPYAV